MFKRIDELVDVVIQEQKLEQELKYDALIAQINPHFLFNTLNAIKWTAMMSGSQNVSEMLSSLGKLLEISMNKGADEISFKKEFELVEAYIYIQNVRYNDKFILTFNVDEEIYELKVLKLILQPIVENSVIHGFNGKKIDCLIKINALKQDNFIRVEVIDNGIGIDKNGIEQILIENDMNYARQKFNRIGLKNIQERLRLKYGDKFGLEVESREGMGTKVTVILPIIP